MTTNNAINIATGATSTVLQGAGVGIAPTFTATPTLTSVTFGAGNALNTYVTNTWTPNLQIAGSNTGITYTNQDGGYTQIGNVVNIWGRILLSSKGASVGNVTISNLPVSTSTNGNKNTISINWFDQFTAAGYTTLCLQLAASSAVATLIMSSASGSGVSSITNTQLSNTTQFRFSGIYILD